MRFLVCAPSSHGFVYAAISVSKELLHTDHQVEMVTGGGFQEYVERTEIQYLSPPNIRDPAFKIKHWAMPSMVARQARIVSEIIDASRPDAVLTSQLALGPLIAADLWNLPVAVLGMATYLWPASEKRLSRFSKKLRDAKRSRFRDSLKAYNIARDQLGLSKQKDGYQNHPLLGDLYLLRSVPSLEESVSELPDKVRFVGPCLWEPKQEKADREIERLLDRARRESLKVIYVQIGRTFGEVSPWETLVDLLSDKPVVVLADVGRMDYEGAHDAPENFLVRSHLPLKRTMPHADAVIASGHTTTVLGALSYGTPLLLIPYGSGTEDIAECCSRAGTALRVDLKEATEKRLNNSILRLLSDKDLQKRASHVQQNMTGIETRVAELLEEVVDEKQVADWG